MPWLKSAAEMPRNEKIWELSDPLYRLYEGSRFYCAENLTDGHVPTSRITALTPKPATKQQTDALVNRRLWHRLPGLSCKSCLRLREAHEAAELPKTGYIVHDFLEYNPSRSEWHKAEARRLTLASIGGQARAAAPRSGGRFTSGSTSGTAGEITSQRTSGTAGETAGENLGISPASGPAVGPAPYSVLRTPSSGSLDPVIPEPEGTDRSSDQGRGRRGGLRAVGPIAAEISALAGAR